MRASPFAGSPVHSKVGMLYFLKTVPPAALALFVAFSLLDHDAHWAVIALLVMLPFYFLGVRRAVEYAAQRLARGGKERASSS